jgi:hypothetical protein
MSEDHRSATENALRLHVLALLGLNTVENTLKCIRFEHENPASVHRQRKATESAARGTPSDKKTGAKSSVGFLRRVTPWVAFGVIVLLASATVVVQWFTHSSQALPAVAETNSVTTGSLAVQTSQITAGPEPVDDLGSSVYAAHFVDVPDHERQCLARAIFHEARGESYEGQLAVAQVIVNRA